MATAPVSIVPVPGLDFGVHGPPGVRRDAVAPAAHVAVDLGDEAVPGNHGNADVEQPPDVLFDERRGHHCRNDPGGMDRFAVVGNACGLPREACGAAGIAGADESAALDENLGSDLFGHDAPVPFGGARARRADAARKVEVGRMLG